MSNNDSFIDEVTEEVRRDRLFALMRRYGWIGVLGVVAIVAGAAFIEYRKAAAEAKAERFGDAVLAALVSDDPAARVAALQAAETAVSATGSQRAVVALLVGAEAVAADDRPAALAALRSLADDAGQPAIYRQLALLKFVVLSGDDMPAAERDLALAGLAVPGAPFRTLAMEQQALALVDAGQTDAAVALLNQILQDSALTTALRRRATQLMVALGGTPAAG